MWWNDVLTLPTIKFISESKIYFVSYLPKLQIYALSHLESDVKNQQNGYKQNV